MTRTSRMTQIDESLFGSTSSARKNKTTDMSSGAVVISRSELDRIKRNAAMLPSNANNSMQDERMLKLEKAKARTEKMKQLQAASLLREQQNADNSEQAIRDHAIRQAAQEKLDSSSEVVKLLSTMGARASAFKMREQQLHEKEKREALDNEYDHRMDIVMEIDRLKDLKRREDEEHRKLHKRHDDRKIIVEQIEDRKRLQILAAEAREQENQNMRMLMKRYEEEDQKAAERRKIEIERSRVEVIRANAASIQKKKDIKLESRKEVEEILAYQLQRDLELKKREDEEAEIERAKRARQAQLLDEQERVINNQDKREETMARRFAEEKERRERNKEKELRMKRLDDMRGLMASRERAAVQKTQKAQLEKQNELYELEIENRHAAMVEAREQRERKIKSDAAIQHRQGVLSQIEISELKRKKEQAEKFAEGEILKERERREMAKFEAIRDKMVNDLAKQGVDTKFLSEMQAVNLKKLLYKV